ncbi:uncharacterized protein LOC132387959 isoform X1 [Hypanus sabinus]|uniref:uncharacterized protein LOC132387959 isoform X1 n=1 Tax=Hypanus sabinus TaxID=79690 RepID=UPI0028C45FE0|nr:uncharacterized protein LOC132387959 isoform X1 [Hypanus sabinus]
MQRIFDRMDDSEAHMNKKPRITGSRAPSRDGLDPTYSQLNFRNNELLIAKDEDPPVTSRAGEKPETAQAAAQERKSKVKIGNRPYRLVYLLCLVTSALIVTVAGFSIYVSQIRQSQITCDQNHRLLREEVNRTLRQCRLQVHQLNTTLLSTISENSHMHLTQRTSLEHLSALISNLSDLKRRHSDLRHQFTEMETKYRSVNETKAQICELLTSRREQTFSQDWIKNADQRYFISTFEASYDEAKQLCLKYDSNLLEIISEEEKKFVTKAVQDQSSSYWSGKCQDGKVATKVVYHMNAGMFKCSECKWYSPLYHCNRDNHRFICESSAPLSPDNSEMIQDVCQQPVG